MNVLVAEDHPLNQKLARRLLEKQGHRVTIVEDGAQVIDVTSRESFDLLLRDIQMPYVDGFQATAAIREREEVTGGRRLPIIALTAHASRGDAEKCRVGGMDGYVSKPIDRAELYRVIAEVCQKP